MLLGLDDINMSVSVIMCQQGIPFNLSPARSQIVEELYLRGSKVIAFFPGVVNDREIKGKTDKIIDTRRMSVLMIGEKIRKINPDIVICTTIEDVRICFWLPYIMPETDFYYYNLEIYVQSAKWKINNWLGKWANKIDYMQNKLKEIMYVRGCRALVIQDRLRRKISKKYWISHPVTWLIPNSYSASYRKHIVKKNGVIYSGLMSDAVLESFMRQLQYIEGFQLTMAGWGCSNLKKLKDNPNIKIMQPKNSDEEYSRFINEYDIALVWYESETDENIYNIGLSSGKFFKHLSIGQPVIANNAPGLADEIRKHNLGVVINDLSELSDAVEKIYADYDVYTGNIKRVYEKKYDYKKVSKKFFDKVINDTNRRGNDGDL